MLDRLTSLLFQTNSSIVRECCWALSNIAAGPQTHIEAMIRSAAFERVLNLCHSKNIDNKKESLWVVCNAITGADLLLRTEIMKIGEK